MKVLIEIDEEVYEHIRESSGLAYAVEDYLHEVEWAIKNGTPLPKEYGDLIDRDALSGEIFCNADITDTHTCFNSIDKIVKDAPAIIEAESEDKE